MSGPRRLYEPVPASVQAGPGGRPLVVDGTTVVAVRESWLIEDRWWTGTPLRRRYWELVTESGELVVVFRDLTAGGSVALLSGAQAAPQLPDGGRWYRQRGALS